MNIIFLKLEGTIMCKSTGWNINPYTVAYLKRICKESNTKIVLTSDDAFIKPILSHLKEFIFQSSLHENCTLPDIDQVRSMSSNDRKAKRISKYCSDNNVTKYIILDDKINTIGSQSNYQYSANTNDGITSELMIEIISYFGCKPITLDDNDIVFNENYLLTTLNKYKINEQKVSI